MSFFKTLSKYRQSLSETLCIVCSFLIRLFIKIFVIFWFFSKKKGGILLDDKIKIDISRDKLTATLRVLGSEPPSLEEIGNKLKSSGIVHGIIPAALEKCTIVNLDEPVVIARGTPPVPGKNGWVELLWECNNEFSRLEDDEIVDYRETSKLCSVNEDDLLAEKYPPVPGEPGKAVTGELIMPPEPKKAVIVAGRGVRLSSDGNKAYSTIQGMPVAKRTGETVLLKVEHLYTVPGDVFLKTGNIRFKGDVLVTGNVTETMTVEASGNVRVYGIVTGAQIMCGDSLVVYKNIIGSKIIAGMGAVECTKIKYLMEDLLNDFKNLVELIEPMKDRLAAVDKLSFAQVIHGLIDMRFKNIKANVKQLITTPTFNLPYEVAEVIEAAKVVAGVSFNQHDINKLMHHLDNALTVIGIQDGKNSTVKANSIHGSTINCSGEVVVTGKGCVNSNIFAQGNVRINGPFKGGQIVSEGNVEIDELGSGLGSPAFVRVKPKNYIKVRKTNPGSIIQIGSLRLNVTKELSAAKFIMGLHGESIDIV